MLNVFWPVISADKSLLFLFLNIFLLHVVHKHTNYLLVVHGGVYANGCTLHLIVNRIYFLQLTRTVG